MTDSAMAAKVCVALFVTTGLLHRGSAFTVAEARSLWHEPRPVESACAVGTRIRAGQVYLNGDVDLFDLTASSGGCKKSDNGREGVQEAPIHASKKCPSSATRSPLRPGYQEFMSK